MLIYQSIRETGVASSLIVLVQGLLLRVLDRCDRCDRFRLVPFTPGNGTRHGVLAAKIEAPKPEEGTTEASFSFETTDGGFLGRIVAL